MGQERVDELLAQVALLQHALETERARGAKDVDRAEWLSAVLALSPDVITIMDLHGGMLYVSRTVPGRIPSQFLGLDSAKFIPNLEDKERWRATLRRTVETGSAQTIEVVGTQGIWSTRVAPIRGADGTISYLLTIGTDITAQKEAAAALAIQEEFLQLALSASEMGQWRWTVDANVVTWDAAAKRIFAWPPDHDQVTFDDFLMRVHPADRERVAAHLRAARASGHYSDLECRILLPDGVTRWVLAKGKVIRDATGTTHLIGGVFDTTQSRRTEAQLRTAQKLEAIGQLAGGIAHDFNNLLVAIMGHAQLARDETDPTKRDELLGLMLAACGRAAQLTHQLLTFGSRQQVLDVALDVNAALADTVTLLRRVFPEKIEIDFVPAKGLPHVLGDRGQIEQVFMNLCVNARDAMPNGGRLVLETEAVVLDERFVPSHPWVKPGGHVRLVVRDTGVGIPHEAIDRIFEPFFTTKAQGSGLGLATVYGIVRRHGGLVHVTSEVGKGTTFEVYLPTADAAAAEVGSKVAVPVAGGRECILVAEDEPMVRAIIVRILEHAGYRVIVAENGARAVEAFLRDEDAIQLVLMDTVMPQQGGVEALAEIRARRPDIAAILSSGYSDALAAGPPDARLTFLSKPYVPDTLLRTVREALDAKRGPA